jgi:hypothetical protein
MSRDRSSLVAHRTRDCWIACLLLSLFSVSNAFVAAPRPGAFLSSRSASSAPSSLITRPLPRKRRLSRVFLQYNDFESDDAAEEEEEEEEDDDDDLIDADSLGDWRAFRRNLAGSSSSLLDNEDDADDKKKDLIATPRRRKMPSKENEEVLWGQNKDLAQEYSTSVWAHETSTVRAVCSATAQHGKTHIFLFSNHIFFLLHSLKLAVCCVACL